MSPCSDKHGISKSINSNLAKKEDSIPRARHLGSYIRRVKIFDKGYKSGKEDSTH